VIEIRTMRKTDELDGTLGYDGDLAILAGSAGTVTWLPDEGAVIERGDRLYELDGSRRARLMYGSRPMWRTLGPGVSNGADVEQLERNLKALGYAPKGMKVDRHWGSRTTTAVKRWQKATGQERDGTVEPGDVVFQPGAIRVREAQAPLGSQVAPGAAVLAATSATRAVSVDLDATDHDELAPGDAVSVELPDGTIVDGRVASVGRVAEVDQQSGSVTLPVSITLDDPDAAPDLDRAPVTIHVVTESREDVLAVPVNALLALLEGGYAVEVVNDDGSRHYVGVEIGLHDDGWVEISGTGLDAGTRVVTAR
jgi:peptidoglycan hydrolase-like protein with peptidoglycan-binding domain